MIRIIVRVQDCGEVAYGGYEHAEITYEAFDVECPALAEFMKSKNAHSSATITGIQILP